MPAIQAASLAYPYPLLIKQLLYTPLAHSPAQEIVYRGEMRYTYLDLRRRIGQLASCLASFGTRHGDTVAVMDWDSHRYLECYFAVPMMGAVLQTVNVKLSPEQILYTLNHAGAKVVLVHRDFLPILKAIKDRLKTVETFVLIADGLPSSGVSIEGFAGEYEDLVAGAATEFDFPDFDENTRATTFYTTGTTGIPKGVYFSHRQLVLHTLSFMAALAISSQGQSFHRQDVYMPITPMFHVHAWGLPYIATTMGVKQVYLGRYVPDLLLSLIAQEGVTFSHCVPTLLHMLLNTPKIKEIKKTALKGWKLVIGGAALPPHLAKTALDLGIDIFAGYGMSETCPVLTLAQLKPEHVSEKEQLALRCKTGLPIPLVDLRVVDAEMNDVPHDGKTVGEVVVRAPWLTQGYYKDPEASAQLWAGGYLHTQDVAHIDVQGYVQITDRTKDMIKVSGEWVSSLEMEALILQHPAVSEVAVIGCRDEKWSERPLALVVLKPGAAATQGEIVAHVKMGGIRGYALPKKVFFVPQIEKTSVGKIDKKLLRQNYAGRE